MKDKNISKAQLEVWEWKEKAYEELKNIPGDKWMQHIRNNTQATIDEILRKQKLQKL